MTRPSRAARLRLAIAENRLRATVRHPAARSPGHAALGDDARAPIRTAAAQRSGDEPLVVPQCRFAGSVRVRGVEDRDSGIGGGGDCFMRDRVVTIAVRREAHAAETDAELGGIGPSRTVQGSEGTARSRTP